MPDSKRSQGQARSAGAFADYNRAEVRTFLKLMGVLLLIAATATATAIIVAL